MKNINFSATDDVHEVVRSIVIRAEKMGITKDRISTAMDLLAVNNQGCSLDFQRLLAFPDFDFTHDVCGIARHVNRDTGKLQNCFLPRCARSA